MKKTNTPFVALISSDEKELYIGGPAIEIAGGMQSGGRTADIVETPTEIKIIFSFFATKSTAVDTPKIEVGYEMKITKTPQLKISRLYGGIKIRENSDSVLILYANPEKMGDDGERNV